MVTSVLFSPTGVPTVSGDAVPATVPTTRVAAFEDALARQNATPIAGTNPVLGIDPAQAVKPTTETPVADMDAQDRARRGLGLDAAAPVVEPGNGGDMILNGMQQLRGVFDVREANIAELMSRQSLDTGTLMAMQMEVANFTLLVDIASKLTGKSTQALDTLMKGQ